MNILVTSFDLEPQFIAGDKRVTLTLSKEWMKLGHKVLILCYRGDSSFHEPSVEGVDQVFLPDITLYSTANITYMRQLIKERNLNILLHQHVMEDDFNRLCASVKDSIKIVSVLHFDVLHEEKTLKQDFFIQYRNNRQIKKYLIDTVRFIKYQLKDRVALHKKIADRYRFIYDMSDCVSLLSERMIANFASYLLVDVPRQVIGINNPAVISYMHEPALISQKEKIVVWCGRLSYGQKRLDRMLRIWKKISDRCSDWKLYVLGSGDLAYWRTIIQKKNIKHVELLGFVNPLQYYQKASILCMTSTSEGFPMVLIESQSYACVPLAFDSFSSLQDIITDGENGLVIHEFDEDQYAQQLTALMKQTDYRERLAINALNSVKRFRAENIAGQWIQVFEKLLMQ